MEQTLIVKDSLVRTPLHHAAERANTDAVRLLLEHGGNPNARDTQNRTPLHHAAVKADAGAVRLLLEHGANPNDRDRENRTPLHHAVIGTDAGAARLLLEHGANLNDRDDEGYTPLDQAVIGNNADAVHLLLEGGADITAINQDFIHVLLEAPMPPEDLLRYLEQNQIQTFIRALPIEERINHLDTLATRAFANPGMATVIEWFEAQFGVRKEHLPSSMDPWSLREHWEINGTETTQAHMQKGTWIGIVTDTGLSYDNIIKAASLYWSKHPETRFAYVTQAMIDDIGIEAFNGLIFPGAGDNYPGHLDAFTLEHMPEEEQTQTEQVYQYVYELAHEAGIPTLGICAGAQHLALHRGASLTKNKTSRTDIRLNAHHVPHFLSLTPEERLEYFKSCKAEDMTMNVFRAHGYSAVSEILEENGLTLAAEDGATPLAFYDGFEVIATQYHPEARYSGVSRYGDAEDRARQTNLLNGFFALCENHKAWMNWADNEGISRSQATTMRNAELQRILNRLEECRKHSGMPTINDGLGRFCHI